MYAYAGPMYVLPSLFFVLLLSRVLSRLSDQGGMVALLGVSDQTNFVNVPP